MNNKVSALLLTLSLAASSAQAVQIKADFSQITKNIPSQFTNKEAAVIAVVSGAATLALASYIYKKMPAMSKNKRRAVKAAIVAATLIAGGVVYKKLPRTLVQEVKNAGNETAQGTQEIGKAIQKTWNSMKENGSVLATKVKQNTAEVLDTVFNKQTINENNV